ncbi:MAG: PASTA domain-containing protein [Nannocystaceae bacterium]|nr:PASTA domain-containing protein [Myxococcales bacterium]
MNETLKMFLISLITAVLVQFALGPQIMKMQGMRQPVPQAPQMINPAAPQPIVTPTPQPTPQPEPPQMINAPDYRGIPVKTARSLASSQGIVIIEDEQKPAADKQPGEILEQNPPPGAPMATREVRVVVAAVGAIVDVPDVIGKDYESAKQLLEDAGFTVAEPIKKGSEKTPGTVLSQNPSSAKKAAAGSDIQLEIASLPLIKVPKVTGMYLSRARGVLRDAGLELGKRRVREHAEHGENYVLSQEPKEGAEVPFGTAVDVVVVAPN